MNTRFASWLQGVGSDKHHPVINPRVLHLADITNSDHFLEIVSIPDT